MIKKVNPKQMKGKRTLNLFFIVIVMMILSPLFAAGNVTSDGKESKGFKEKATIIETKFARDVAQQRVKISGRVVDQDGFPLPGVAISVKERKGVGVATDAEGKYSIECGAKETLVYTYVGFLPQEQLAGEINGVTVTLKEDILTLDEVQVVAFGKQKKESVISSISTVTPGELRVPSSNITTAFA
ncbi:carboxypeptidase-like regulatory domain-containing protein, partial [Proteiniphilum sp. UBA5259]